VTIGQYLRPSAEHLPVVRWVGPDEFAEYREMGRRWGIDHVEASPLTRSSYHARSAADHAGVAAPAITPVPVGLPVLMRK
jgi:lipoic acid synthetase